ncbi:hypothetical protein HDU93_002454 [Gonapodya sp. JEL0774]|nr:hypothetical protein HDU93_002454 [Gonapodya sp. JEL0774]
MMSYGIKEWAEWVIPEEEALPVIGKAWELGINCESCSLVSDWQTLILSINDTVVKSGTPRTSTGDFDGTVSLFALVMKVTLLNAAMEYPRQSLGTRDIKRFNIPRDRIVIATKVRGSAHPDEPGYSSFGKPPRPGWIDKNRAGLSRKCIMQEVEGSLKRLGTD